MVHQVRPTSFVRHADVDGCRILLDLNTESYRVLDPIGSVMWSALIGESDWTSARQLLVDSYEVSAEDLNSDFEDFAAKCHAQQLIAEPLDFFNEELFGGVSGEGLHRPMRTYSRLPALVHAILIFYRTRYALTRYGFRATYERYTQLPAGSGMTRLSGALSTFSRAEHFFISRRAPNDCLVRSLALFRFLREQSIPAEHVIGVARMPFQAHAWVECGGQPILDQQSMSRTFVPLARITADTTVGTGA